MDNGKLVGTLSEQDIWHHCPTSAVVMNEQQVEDLLGHVRVAGVMALQPLTITLDTPLHEAAQRFTPAKRQPLVVMENGVPKLVPARTIRTVAASPGLACRSARAV